MPYLYVLAFNAVIFCVMYMLGDVYILSFYSPSSLPYKLPFFSQASLARLTSNNKGLERPAIMRCSIL
jgi:hypothetical protein